MKKNLGALTSNLLIQKKVYLKNLFSDEIKQYGYEDTLFLYQLEQNSINVVHLDNPLYHLNLETSEVFIEKTKLALENLKSIITIQPDLSKRIKLTSIYFKLKEYNLNILIVTLFELLKKKIYKNLTSKNPNLFLFDLYKLGLFCKLMR